MCKEFKKVYAFEPINAVRDCIHHNVKQIITNYCPMVYLIKSKLKVVNENETATLTYQKCNTDIEVKRLDMTLIIYQK